MQDSRKVRRISTKSGTQPLSSKNYISLNRVNVFRYFSGVFYNASCNNNSLTIADANNEYLYGVYYNNSRNNTAIISNANNSYSDGIYLDTTSNNNKLSIYNANSNQYWSGLRLNRSNYNTAAISNANNNGGRGIYFQESAENRIYNCMTNNNGTSGLLADYNQNVLVNCTITDSLEVTGFTAFADGRIYSQKHDGIEDNHWIFCDGGTINSQTDVRHTASGIAWKISPTSTNRTENYPLTLSISKIAVNANAQVTVRAWMKKSHATNIVGKLVVRGKQIAGVDSDVVATKANDTDWEQLTLTFTPTEKGVVEVEAWAYSGTSTTDSVYVDDMSFSQA